MKTGAEQKQDKDKSSSTYYLTRYPTIQESTSGWPGIGTIEKSLIEINQKEIHQQLDALKPDMALIKGQESNITIDQQEEIDYLQSKKEDILKFTKLDATLFTTIEMLPTDFSFED